MSPPPASEWYDQGLRFECTMCGACCTGPPGYVSFTREEAKAIAKRLDITLDRFLRDYTHLGPRGASLNEVETEHGFDCVFLDRDAIPGKAVCSIHEVRPKQCRTFPWWPEVLESKRAWERAARTCEGMNQGRLVPIEEIRISVGTMKP
jgi:hypothetical protein